MGATDAGVDELEVDERALDERAVGEPWDEQAAPTTTSTAANPRLRFNARQSRTLSYCGQGQFTWSKWEIFGSLTENVHP